MKKQTKARYDSNADEVQSTLVTCRKVLKYCYAKKHQ